MYNKNGIRLRSWENCDPLSSQLTPKHQFADINQKPIQMDPKSRLQFPSYQIKLMLVDPIKPSNIIKHSESNPYHNYEADWLD